MTKIFDIKVTTEEKLENVEKLKEVVNKIIIEDDYLIIIKHIKNGIISTSIFDGTNSYENQAICVVGLIETINEFIKDQSNFLRGLDKK